MLDTSDYTGRKDDASISSNYSSFDSESDFEMAQDTSKSTSKDPPKNTLGNTTNNSPNDNKKNTTNDSAVVNNVNSEEPSSDRGVTGDLEHDNLVLNYLKTAELKDISSCVVDKLDEMRKNALGNKHST